MPEKDLHPENLAEVPGHALASGEAGSPEELCIGAGKRHEERLPIRAPRMRAARRASGANPGW